MFSGSAPFLSAYFATDYVVFFGTRQIGIRPSIRSADIEKLLRRRKVRATAFITAFNPRGVDVGRSRNLAANRRLTALLRRAGYPVLSGEGRGDIGRWQPEPSLLALGIGGKRAALVGGRFGQNAIVYVKRGQPAELMRLR